MADFGFNMEEVSSAQEHSLPNEEKEQLKVRFFDLKFKVEQEGYEMNLEDQRLVVQWLRADRETKFILNSKPVKAVKEPKERSASSRKVSSPREPSAPSGRKPKKLSQKALGTLYLKGLRGEALTEDELKDKLYTESLRNV